MVMEIKPFLPPLLPLAADDDYFGSFEALAFQAGLALARLSGMMAISAKADLFWLNWLMREAQISNKIEGTVTTLDEILGENVGLRVAPERKDDVSEVMNYRDAMITGMEQLRTGRTITLSLIKELHAQLLSGVRGESKTPGMFRLIPVHIGNPPEYVPPEAIYVPDLLENLEKFMNRDDINPVVQAAIMHAQFEMIHPFCDGNGRLGRLLITLFLTQKGLLDLPCFYMSAYLHTHRKQYYTFLNQISHKNNWQGWIQFFLKSVIARSNDNIVLLTKMSELYESSKKEFCDSTGSSHAVEILDYMFRFPLFTLPDLKKNSNIILGQQALNSLISKLYSAGIIIKASEKQGRRPAIWKFVKLMNLIEN